MSDLIERQDAIRFAEQGQIQGFEWQIKKLLGTPSVQFERDIPVPPVEVYDSRAWGFPNREAVCPKCDYCLGHVKFFGDHKEKRITYCEICGQAIDWRGWEEDE